MKAERTAKKNRPKSATLRVAIVCRLEVFSLSIAKGNEQSGIVSRGIKLACARDTIPDCPSYGGYERLKTESKTDLLT